MVVTRLRLLIISHSTTVQPPNLDIKYLLLSYSDEISKLGVPKVSLPTQHNVLSSYQEHAPFYITVFVSHVDPFYCLGQEQVPELVQ